MSQKITKSRLPILISRQNSVVSVASLRDESPEANSFLAKPPVIARSMSVVSYKPTNSNATATNLQKPLDLTERRRGYSSTQSTQIRKTRSNLSLPTDDTNSMQISAISKNGKAAGDKVKRKIQMQKPLMNLVTQQRLDKSRTSKGVVGFGPSNTKMATSSSQSALKQQDNCHRSVTEFGRLRNFEAMHRKLEDMQSNFFNKLRNLAPSELSRTSGRYKFVSLVTNKEMKVLLHEDDIFRLPKYLPRESVNDLKDRCAAVVETGFALLFEALPQIQLATSEVESLKLREVLRKKLQSLLNRKVTEISSEIHDLCKSQKKLDCPDVARLYQEVSSLRAEKKEAEAKYFDSKRDYADQLELLQSNSDTALTVEISKRENQIADMTKSMASLQAQISDQIDLLTEKNAALQALEQNKIELLNELNKQKLTNADLMQRLAAANENLESSVTTGQKNADRVEYLKAELKEAHELIVSLQRGPYAIDQNDLLAQKNVALQDLQQSQIELVNELNKQKLTNADLMQRLAAANENLESSVTTGQKNADRVEYLKAELKEAHELIVSLQRGPYAIDQNDLLAQKNVALQDLQQSQIELVNELNKQKLTNADLMQRLAAANENLESSVTTGQKNTERIKYLEDELKEARELIMNLKSRPDTSEQSDLLAQKHDALESLQQSHIELLNEVNKQKLTIADLIQRLAAASENLESYGTTGQNNTERVEYLEAELKEARDLIVNLQRRSDTMDRGNKEKESVISHLKAQLKNVEKHKDLLIKQLNNVLKIKVAYNEMQTMYEEALSRISVLQTQIAEKERAIADFSKLEEKLQNQLDHSREEYKRVKEEMVCLQEEIKRNHQLLHARSEMISSLVARGEDAEKTMDEVYSKIKNELDSKNVEIRNLFNTLNAKQKDLHRQEHTIKLLEESNDRNVELSAIQEKKNVEMLAELLHLKRTIRSYVKGNNGPQLFENVPIAELAIEQLNESNHLPNHNL